MTGATATTPSGEFPFGIARTPTKSAADQMTGLQQLFDDVASSGSAVFGLPKESPLLHLGAMMSDSGATEEAMRTELEQQRQVLAAAAAEPTEAMQTSDSESESGDSSDMGRDGERVDDDESAAKEDETDAEDDENEFVLELPEEPEYEKDEKQREFPGFKCQKHKVTNITKKTAKDGFKKAVKGEKTAEDLLREVAKGVNQTSKWHLHLGEEFDAHEKRHGRKNHVKTLGSAKQTRHHGVYRSMPALLLSLDPLVQFLSNHAPKSKAKKRKRSEAKPKQKSEEEEDGRMQRNQLNRYDLQVRLRHTTCCIVQFHPQAGQRPSNSRASSPDGRGESNDEHWDV